jgi:outer membrane protein assembly factor BamB
MFGLFAQGAAVAENGFDWPCWRGPERNGLSREAGWACRWGTNGLPVLWRASVGKGFASFAVAGGRACTLGNTDGTDTVFCFEAVTGKVLWRHSYPCELQPLSYEGGPGATPAIDEGRVFTFSKDGHLFCLDAQNGKVVWQKKFELWPWLEGDWKNNWRYSGSPLIVGERLFMSLGQAGMALSKKNGAVLWQSPAGHPGYASPVPFRVDAIDALAFFSGHAVIGVAAGTGKRLWEVPWKTEWDFNAADPVISDGKMFVSSGNHAGCALYDLAASPPRELWRNKNLKTPMNSSVLWQGHLYGFNDADLTCVEWATGAKKWSESTVRRGSLILTDNKLLLLCEKGKLVVAEASAEAYRPIAQSQILTGRCWTTPVLSHGLIYAHNAAGDVVCLDARIQTR